MAQDDYPNCGFVPDWAERQLLINMLHLVLLVLQQATEHLTLPLGGHMMSVRVQPQQDGRRPPGYTDTCHMDNT